MDKLERPILWAGDSLESVRSLPEEDRNKVGFELHRLQNSDLGEMMSSRKVKQVSGLENIYQLRARDIRIFFSILEDGDKIAVLSVVKRSNLRDSISNLEKYRHEASKRLEGNGV
jgi:mRNA-degrading endonuclease RelE of RelBE toxin-antitoxin system